MIYLKEIKKIIKQSILLKGISYFVILPILFIILVNLYVFLASIIPNNIFNEYFEVLTFTFIHILTTYLFTGYLVKVKDINIYKNDKENSLSLFNMYMFLKLVVVNIIIYILQFPPKKFNQSFDFITTMLFLLPFTIFFGKELYEYEIKKHKRKKN